MSSKSKKTLGNFVVQAGILAAAGIIVRIIGMLYGVPLTVIIKDQGNGYYSAAYYVYSIILMISTYGIPVAVSKVLSAKMAVGEYKNAQRIFNCSLIYVIIVGGMAAVLTYVAAPLMVDMPEAIPALRILAPTVFFSGLLSVFRGFFQAQGDMVPTSVSQIVEQLLNAAVSVGAAYVFTRPYVNTTGNDLYMYGAAGGAVGTGAGVLIGLVYMLIIYIANQSAFKEKRINDTSKNLMDYGAIIKMLVLLITPVLLSSVVYNISTLLDMKVYYRIVALKHQDMDEAAALYGIYSRKYNVLINVPIAMASAMSLAIIPDVSAAFETGQIENTRKKLHDAIRYTMLVCIPSAIGMAVLAKPIMELLFFGSQPVAYHLLTAGFILVVLYGISTVTNGVLQGMGKVNIPVINAAIALVLHLIVLIPLLVFTKLDLYAILISTIVYSGLMVWLNARRITKYLDYHQEIKVSFLIPTVASLVMGIVAYLSFYGCLFLTMQVTSYRIGNAISLFVAMGIAVIVYFILIMKMSNFTEEQLNAIPKGRYLAKIAKKLHLLKKES